MVNCNFLKSNQTVWEKLALTGNSFTAHQQILKTAYNQSMFLNTGNPKLYHNWNKDTICMGITSNLVWNYDKYWNCWLSPITYNTTVPFFILSRIQWLPWLPSLSQYVSRSPSVRHEGPDSSSCTKLQKSSASAAIIDSILCAFYMFWNFDHIRIEEIFIMCLKHKCSHLCMNIKWNTWSYLAVTVS